MPRSKIQLKELTEIDTQEFFENEYPEAKLAFVKSLSLMFDNEQEIDENILKELINKMLNVRDDNLPDSKLLKFIEYLAKNKPKQEIVMMVEEDLDNGLFSRSCCTSSSYTA